MTVNINGTSGVSGVDGTAGTPALQGTDSNTGISFGADTVNINTGGTTRATVDSSGRVGINTSSPAELLHVKASGNYGVIVADNSNTTGGGRFAAYQNGSLKGIFGVSGSIEGNTTSDAGLFAETGGAIRLYTNGSPTAKAILDSSGRLGIGTTSPSNALHISTSDGTPIKIQSTSATSYINFVNSNNGQGYIGYESQEMTFYTVNAIRARIDSSGNFAFNSGYGSVATAYGCRAWVNFNGTGTVAIRANGNVSSITDNSTGDYTVNFTTAMPDANYAACIMGGSQVGAGTRIFMEQHDSVLRSTTQLRIYTLNQNFNTADTAVVSVAIFR